MNALRVGGEVADFLVIKAAANVALAGRAGDAGKRFQYRMRVRLANRAETERGHRLLAILAGRVHRGANVGGRVLLRQPAVAGDLSRLAGAAPLA